MSFLFRPGALNEDLSFLTSTIRQHQNSQAMHNTST